MPPLAHIPLSRVLARCCRWSSARFFCGIHPIATAESSRAFRWSRLVGVIRPLLNLPYYGNRSIEKQKSHHFCNFFAITDSFLFP